MINSFYPKDSDECRTTGCSCCSSELHMKRDKKEILKEARDNIRVVKKICEYYNVKFDKFCKDILTEKQCKKHKFVKKYKDKNVCWNCDKWEEKKEKIL